MASATNSVMKSACFRDQLFLKALRQYDNQFGYDLLLERARHGSPKRAIKELFEETIEKLSGTESGHRPAIAMHSQQ
jgi:hypothetical protein